MKEFISSTIFVGLLFGLTSIVQADTLTGKVKSVDQEGNALTIVSEPSSDGKTVDYNLVWDTTLQDLKSLENAKIGELVIVEAEQNPISRNWKVIAIKGPLSEAEHKFLKTAERMIKGEVREINTSGNSLMLVSEETDANGQRLEYHVVWDETNANVRDHLQKTRVGDKLSLMADQNKLTHNWEAKSIAGPIESITTGSVQTLIGEVKKVDADKNSLIMNTVDASGHTVERKIVWEKNFREQDKLENAKIGEHLTVQADQNILTRNWKVKAIG